MMTNFYLFASALALAGLAVPVAAQPRSAAVETSADPSVSRPFMFTGATVRVPLGAESRHKPELAMRIAGGVSGSGFAPRIGEGFAFSAVPGAKPQITLAGQDTKMLARRMNMSGGAKTTLIIGGVVVIAAVAAVALSDWGDAPAAAFEDN